MSEHVILAKNRTSNLPNITKNRTIREHRTVRSTSSMYLYLKKITCMLTGTFNGWQKMKMSRSQKDFVAMVDLGEGNHEYKFFVDGQWQTDPNAPIIENSSGFKNNVLHVQKGDFDAFEALDMDMETVSKAQSHKAKTTMRPQTQFGQEMPHIPINSGISNSSDHPVKSSGPPILPPHLLQVILNKVCV